MSQRQRLNRADAGVGVVEMSQGETSYQESCRLTVRATNDATSADDMLLESDLASPTQDKVVTGELLSAAEKSNAVSTADHASQQVHVATVQQVRQTPNDSLHLAANESSDGMAEEDIREIHSELVAGEAISYTDDTTLLLFSSKGKDDGAVGQWQGGGTMTDPNTDSSTESLPPTQGVELDNATIASLTATVPRAHGQSGNPKYTQMNQPFNGWTKEVIVRIQGDRTGRPPGAAVPQYTPPGDSAPILRERARVIEYLEKNHLPQSMINAFDFMPLFCICHREDNSFLYIECSANIAGCGGWFHAPCAGWTDTELEEQSKLYMATICPLCTLFVIDTPSAKLSLYNKLHKKLDDESRNFRLADSAIHYRIQTSRIMWLIRDGKYYVTTGLCELPSLISPPRSATTNQETPTCCRIDVLDFRTYTKPHKVWGEVTRENSDQQTDILLQRYGSTKEEKSVQQLRQNQIHPISALPSRHRLVDGPLTTAVSTPSACPLSAVMGSLSATNSSCKHANTDLPPGYLSSFCPSTLSSLLSGAAVLAAPLIDIQQQQQQQGLVSSIKSTGRTDPLSGQRMSLVTAGDAAARTDQEIAALTMPAHHNRLPRDQASAESGPSKQEYASVLPSVPPPTSAMLIGHSKQTSTSISPLSSSNNMLITSNLESQIRRSGKQTFSESLLRRCALLNEKRALAKGVPGPATRAQSSMGITMPAPSPTSSFLRPGAARLPLTPNVGTPHPILYSSGSQSSVPIVSVEKCPQRSHLVSESCAQTVGPRLSRGGLAGASDTPPHLSGLRATPPGQTPLSSTTTTTEAPAQGSSPEIQVSCGIESGSVHGEGWCDDLYPTFDDLELEHFLATTYSTHDFDDTTLEEALNAADSWSNAAHMAELDATASVTFSNTIPTHLTSSSNFSGVHAGAEYQKDHMIQHCFRVDGHDDDCAGESALCIDWAGCAPLESSKIPWVIRETLEVSDDVEANDIRVASIPTSASSEEKKHVFVSIRGGWKEFEDMALYSKIRRRDISSSSAIRLEVRVKSKLIDAAMTEITTHNDKRSRMTKKQITASHGLRAPVYAPLPLNDGGMTLTTLVPGTLPPLQHYHLSKCAICFNPLRGMREQMGDVVDRGKGDTGCGAANTTLSWDDNDRDDPADGSGEFVSKRLRKKRRAAEARLSEIARSAKRSVRNVHSQDRMLGVVRCRIHDKCWDLISGTSLQKSLDRTVSSGIISMQAMYAYSATDTVTCDLCGRFGGAIFGFTFQGSVHQDIDVCTNWVGHWPCILFLAHSGMLCTGDMFGRCLSSIDSCESAIPGCKGDSRLESGESHNASLVFVERLNKYICSLCGEQNGLTVGCSDPTCTVVAHHLCALLGGWGIHCIQGTKSPLFHCPYHSSNVSNSL